MKNYIYSILFTLTAAIGFTSCDSEADKLEASETIGVYAGDIIIQLVALEDDVEFEGDFYDRGELIDEIAFKMADKDTSYAYLNINNTGSANIWMLFPDDHLSETSGYYIELNGIQTSELGNRVASVGVTDIAFGKNLIHTSTLFQRYNHAEFEHVWGEQYESDFVSGEVAYICGNYQLVVQATITDCESGLIKGVGYNILFYNSWLSRGQDANELMKRRNKR